MLNNIPAILSPEMLKVLCEMGHGDTIVLADANFPSASIGRGKIVLRCDGHGIPALLKAVLTLFPLDTYTPTPVAMMRPDTPGEADAALTSTYTGILQSYGGVDGTAIRQVERYAFYQEAGKAYAVVATSEMIPYANIILQKGNVRES